jgi:hypothetical protein
MILETLCVGVIIIYLGTKFHMLSSNGSLDTAIKPKSKDNFCMNAMLLFYTLQNEITLSEVAQCLKI